MLNPPPHQCFSAVDATRRPYPNTLGTGFLHVTFPHVKTLPNSLTYARQRAIQTRVNLTPRGATLQFQQESVFGSLLMGLGGIFTVLGISLWIYSHSASPPWGLWPWTFPIITLVSIASAVTGVIKNLAMPWKSLIELRDEHLILPQQAIPVNLLHSTRLRLCQVIGRDFDATFERPRPVLMLLMEHDQSLHPLVSFTPRHVAKSSAHIQRVLARAEIDCEWERDVAYVIQK